MCNANTVLDRAQEYVSLGFQIFPVHTIDDNGQCSCGKPDCRDAGKHPMTRHGVKDATDDPDKVIQFFQNKNCNIGIATGEASAVWVLDDDGLAANKHLTEALPPTWTVQTGSGKRQYYFRYGDNTPRLKNRRIPNTEMDVRATGGYVVAPPSVHKSGGQYQWIRHPKDCPLVDAPDWLLDMCPKHETEIVHDDVQDSSTSLASDSKEHANVPDDDDVFHVAVSDDGNDLFHRAKAYLETCSPAISGQNGHGQAYKVIANLMELFGSLSDDDLLTALSEWNSRCRPSWSQKELRHKVSDARLKTTTERRVDTQPSPNDIDTDTVVHCPLSVSDDAFHGLLGDIVQTVAPETEADPMGVLVSLLTAFGNAVGKGPRFNVGAGVHHANLFATLVGDTASGKGQAWSIVSRLMEQADPEWKRDCIARGLSSGEGLIERLQDEESDDPFFVPSTKRLLCLETELARPISAMRREGCTLSPILRSAWDCDSLEVITRGKSKLKASNAYLSILSHITADELAKIMANSVEVVNGFANRFLWCCVRCQKLLPHGGDMTVLNGYGDRLRIAIEEAKTITEIKRSDEANKLWEEIYPELKRPRKGAYGRATDRGAPQVVRLSMLYALADGHPTITVDHLKAALAVWRYCDQSARLLFSEDESDPIEKRILDILPATKTEIRQRLSSKARETYSDALDSLVRKRLIVLNDNLYSKTVDAGRLDAVDSARNGVQSPESPESPESTKSTTTEMASSVQKVQNVQSPASTDTATMAELFDWMNEHGIELLKNVEGNVWVSPQQEHHLSPSIRSAITKYRIHLVNVASLETEDDDGITLSIDGQAFFEELNGKPETKYAGWIRQAISD